MTDPRNLRHTCAGLSLVEVMIALAIAGIGLTVMMATTSRCLAVASKAKRYEEARRLIAQVELESPIDREEITAGNDGGGFSDYAYRDYTWSRVIEDIGRDPEDGMYLVRTRVSWTGRRGSAYEEVETYIYAPESEEDGAP